MNLNKHTLDLLTDKTEFDTYVFFGKDWITVSRHKRPDFVAGLTNEEIAKNFKIVGVNKPK